MTPSRLQRSPRWLRIAVRAGLIGAGLMGLYLAVTFVQVLWVSRQDDATEAQAIVVMGAAQYDGTPSPVFEARLDHALDLYQQGLAPTIVVTGGNQPGDRFTEAAAGANYLLANGVPDEDIRREVDAQNSWESLAATARILENEGADEVILVSDPYHSFRVAQIARRLGLTVHVSPTRSGPGGAAAELRSMVRETVAVSIGRFVGYRRLVSIDDQVGNIREGVGQR